MVLTPLMLFYGSRADSVVAITGSPPTDVNSFVSWDSSYSDSALNPNGGFYLPFTDSTDAATSVGVGHSCYLHLCVSTANSALLNNVLMQMLDSSGNPWLQLKCVGSGDTYQWQYNSNTGGSPTWTNLSSSLTMNTSSGLATLDMVVSLVSGGGHSAQFVVNGALQFTQAFTNANLTNLAKVACYSNGNGATGYSQMMVTQDLSTVGGHVKTIRATGAGTYGQWTGAYTDVNEVVVSDSTFNQATSNSLKQSYAMADVTVPTGYVIKGVRQCIRVKNDGANSPLNVDSLARSGGTDYISGSLAGVSVAFGPAGKRYDNDPNTSAAWIQSGVNALELGYVSAA